MNAMLVNVLPLVKPSQLLKRRCMTRDYSTRLAVLILVSVKMMITMHLTSLCSLIELQLQSTRTLRGTIQRRQREIRE
jgi:hypothetical protein